MEGGPDAEAEQENEGDLLSAKNLKGEDGRDGEASRRNEVPFPEDEKKE